MNNFSVEKMEEKSVEYLRVLIFILPDTISEGRVRS